MVRMNIYAEELTPDVEIVEKTAETGAHFIGVRFYLKSPPDLHHTEKDDDRSAVTFWVKSSKEGFKEGDQVSLYKLLMVAGNKLSEKAYDLAHPEKVSIRKIDNRMPPGLEDLVVRYHQLIKLGETQAASVVFAKIEKESAVVARSL